jgi:hypothetical protein
MGQTKGQVCEKKQAEHDDEMRPRAAFLGWRSRKTQFGIGNTRRLGMKQFHEC